MKTPAAKWVLLFSKNDFVSKIVSAPEIRSSSCNDCNIFSTNSGSKLLY